MPNLTLLVAFFIFVMAGVVTAGYYLLLRPAGNSAGATDQSAAQVLTDNLRSLGGALPDPKAGGALRKRLIAAGYRDPEAVDLFNGLTYATAALLGLIVAAAVLISTGSFASAFVPGLCGVCFGYLLPKKVLTTWCTRV
jgi:hypothetical protein